MEILSLILVFSNANECWINQNLDILSGYTLQQITLPGTHQSPTFFLTQNIITDYDQETLQLLQNVANILGIPVLSLVEAWAIAQDQLISTQLKDGIRYLDFRAAWLEDIQDWVIHHTLTGLRIKPLLGQISSFLETKCLQIVVIQISQFQGDPTDQQIDLLRDIIVEQLGDFLYPVDESFGFTVGEMVQGGKTVIVSMEEGEKYGADNIWPEDVLYNTYANSAQIDQMFQYNLEQVQVFNGNSWEGQLFKISWILTPDADTITKGVLINQPGTLIELAEFANQSFDEFIVAVQGQRTGNLLLIDAYESSTIVEVVKEMNGIEVELVKQQFTKQKIGY